VCGILTAGKLLQSLPFRSKTVRTKIKGQFVSLSTSETELSPAKNAQDLLNHTTITDLLKRDVMEWADDWKNKVTMVGKATNLSTEVLQFHTSRVKWVAD
jgi:hypothetical protein